MLTGETAGDKLQTDIPSERDKDICLKKNIPIEVFLS